MEISVPAGTTIKIIKNIIFVNAVRASSGKIIGMVRKGVCQFQLDYTNYFFLSSRLHKEFKEANKADTKAQAHATLNDFLESGLKKLFGEIAEDIQEYFTETHSSSIPPRVGIHLVTEDSEVIDVIQIPSTNNADLKPKIIKDYTVLEEVIETGKPYIENNIPKHVINSENYKHKGLDTAKIREKYKLCVTDCKLISRWRNNIFSATRKDKKWCEMRANYSDKGHSQLYKSHIVIPITYRRHADKASMSEKMVRVLQLQDNGRSILGFLFVDHPETYYFDNSDPYSYMNIDINSLMVFSDMISMAIVTKLMYTKGSNTINKYKQPGKTQ